MSSVSSGSTGQRLLPARVTVLNWPLVDDGWVSLIVIGVYVGVAIAAALLTESLGMTVLALAAMAAAQWRFWIPIRYELGPLGISRSLLGRKRHVHWKAVESYRVRKRGIQLWPASAPSPISASWYIRWKNQRDSILKILDYYQSGRAAYPVPGSSATAARSDRQRSPLTERTEDSST